jgi:hypothetical protein
MIINKKYFKDYSPLPINYNLDEVMLYVPIATKVWLIPIIGQPFYDEIEYQVKNNQVSEEISTLLTTGGLYQFLCYATCLQALPFIWSHFSEAGITKSHSENSESLDLKDLAYIEGHLRRTVETLKDQLIEFLCTHQSSFPIFNPAGICPCCNGCCDDGKLNKPQPLFEIYSTLKRCTNLI